MLQVESKLELFEDVVYKRRLTDLQKRKEAWEQEKNSLLERKEKQLNEEKDNIVRRRADLARVMGNEKIAKAKENERVLELKKINELKKTSSKPSAPGPWNTPTPRSTGKTWPCAWKNP